MSRNRVGCLTARSSLRTNSVIVRRRQEDWWRRKIVSGWQWPGAIALPRTIISRLIVAGNDAIFLIDVRLFISSSRRNLRMQILGSPNRCATPHRRYEKRTSKGLVFACVQTFIGLFGCIKPAWYTIIIFLTALCLSVLFNLLSVLSVAKLGVAYSSNNPVIIGRRNYSLFPENYKPTGAEFIDASAVNYTCGFHQPES